MINFHNSIPQIFDRSLGRLRRQKCDIQDIINHPLHLELQDIILERLSFIQRSFETVLVMGDFPIERLQPVFNNPKMTIHILNTTSQANVNADVEFLPFKKKCADLVISYFDLHTVNDIPGVLRQIRDSLKPDGLFLGVMLGGESLWELRQVCQLAEEKIRGGVSPRVAPMIALQDAAALMQRAGFALPVVDHEMITRLYATPLSVLKDLKAIGLSNILRDRHKELMTFGLLREIVETYSKEFKKQQWKIPCAFDVIFLSGWGPAPEQQIPLIPGSAQIHLSQML